MHSFCDTNLYFLNMGSCWPGRCHDLLVVDQHGIMGPGKGKSEDRGHIGKCSTNWMKVKASENMTSVSEVFLNNIKVAVISIFITILSPESTAMHGFTEFYREF